MGDAAGGRRRSRSGDRIGDQRGSIALLALGGSALTLLIAMVPLIVAADLVITRQRVQVAADAAALAAMSAPPAGARGAADALAERNGAELRRCRCDDPAHREVVVTASPASTLLRVVVPDVEAHAAAALVPAHASALGGDLAGGAPRTAVAGGTGARVWPLAAPVTSGFGTRVHPVTGVARLHAGLDLGAPTGTPIRAAAAGTVIAAGGMGGYGNTVDLRHADGTVTRYAHQSRLLVGVGQTVAAGQVIGLVGSTGVSTGPHLHFEVRSPAGPIDPTSWLPR